MKLSGNSLLGVSIFVNLLMVGFIVGFQISSNRGLLESNVKFNLPEDRKHDIMARLQELDEMQPPHQELRKVRRDLFEFISSKDFTVEGGMTRVSDLNDMFFLKHQAMLNHVVNIAADLNEEERKFLVYQVRALRNKRMYAAK